MWQKRSTLKNTKYSLNENFSRDAEFRRRKLYPIFHAARGMEEYRNKVFLTGDVLTVNGNRYPVDKLDDLPANLHPSNFTSRSDENTHVFGGILSEFNLLSNYDYVKFNYNDTNYSSAEQAIQHAKALKHNDRNSAEKIMLTDDPSTTKELGHKVKAFNKHSWNTVKGDVVLKILRAKFAQNETCSRALLNTGTRRLGESGTDAYFAVGLSLTHKNILNRNMWVCKNKLGSILEQLGTEFQ